MCSVGACSLEAVCRLGHARHCQRAQDLILGSSSFVFLVSIWSAAFLKWYYQWSVVDPIQASYFEFQSGSLLLCFCLFSFCELSCICTYLYLYFCLYLCLSLHLYICSLGHAQRCGREQRFHLGKLSAARKPLQFSSSCSCCQPSYT